MALQDEDTPITDEHGNMVHKDELGQDTREQLGLDNMEDDYTD